MKKILLPLTIFTLFATATEIIPINSRPETVYAAQKQDSKKSKKKKSGKKSKLKKLDEKGTKKFSTHLKKELNKVLAELELTVEVSYIDTLIYVTFPQDLKYVSETDQQRISDGVWTAVQNLYPTWAKENNYRHTELHHFPALYVETEDGVTIAELDKLSGNMKLKN